MLGLEGKTAVVLGGGQGMGESSALCLAQAGCDVALLDLELDRAERVAEKVRALGRRAIAKRADVLNSDQIRAVLAEAEKELAPFDVMAAIVGIAGWSPLVDMSEDLWDLDHRRNLRYFFVAAQAVAKSMLKAGRPGSIVCIASVSGLESAPHHAAYGAAKAGLVSLVRSMATEWSPHGIRVNAVAPGAIVTPRIPLLPADKERAMCAPLPMQRRGTSDEIGKAVLFFASDLASYVTGQTLAVDGGWTSVFLMDPRNQISLAAGAGPAGIGVKT
jgi:NAD(P)-dependent dehydrogenase (short-subunit alcohol dehydrogenase family)